MIPRSADWKNALAAAVRDPAELIALLELPRNLLAGAREASLDFPLRIPRGFVAKMRKGDPDDPLLRQVLARPEELLDAEGFAEDPVGDLAASRCPGLLQKYHGRALVVATGACAIHCRYCFRRHYPYADETPGRDWTPVLEYLAQETAVHEVILSGGDPLLLDDDRLADLTCRLAAIPHVQRLRVHTRLPVVLPERVTPALNRALGAGRLQRVVVIHANHPREVDAPVALALRSLGESGAVLLNQAVLLAGVNDDADILEELSETLFSAGVLPYYLHALDKVRGAAHFAVDDARALTLIEQLRARLPGYLVPRLVRERRGAASKLPLDLTVETGTV